MAGRKATSLKARNELLETVNMKYSINKILLLENENLVFSDATLIITIWNIKSKLQVQQLIGNTVRVKSLAHIKKDIIASGSRDIKFWNCTNGRLLKNLTGHSGSVLDLLSLFSRHLLISSSMDLTIKIWNTTNGKVLKTLQGHKGVVSCVIFLFLMII